ncbi:family 20 glycosylhydrolase [Tichowtungia aerotolerans]|uniref:beta-N-acetylhexosaminidase n=1 Tax=Tichowtungia aerotolerans TaxID=2697043 RepID=A0A6P1M8N8_9BACT|nr:family 20 glycosylhydrolase [Tichowtungia aerotolerans]QHI70392.1 family 20 glycosylhydrolase [Tichowtungia aerotolerans]
MRNIHKSMICMLASLMIPVLAFSEFEDRLKELIPVPKTVSVQEQIVAIPAASDVLQIVDPKVAAFRSAVEMIRVRLQQGQQRFSVVDESAGGSTVLMFQKDDGLAPEEYRLVVSQNGMVVSAADEKGIAWAGVTLEQLLGSLRSGDSLPEMTLADRPDQAYRGIMIDVARQPHPIGVIRDVVQLCRWYKLGYLHIHFTDSQLWTLPSTKYPALSAENTTYTKRELEELEAFARSMGVTIVPEFDVPGHSYALIRLMPELGTRTAARGRPVLDVLSDRTYEVLDDLIGELCEIFESTPYIHLGADEVKREKEIWPQMEGYNLFLQKNGLADVEELYRYFVRRVSLLISAHGKTPVAWEGVAAEGNPAMPPELTMMSYECYYEMPGAYIENGHNVINTTWVPLYITNRRHPDLTAIYDWELSQWGHWWPKSAAKDGLSVKPTDRILGGQICAWELPAALEIKLLRNRAGVLGERLWNDRRSLSAEECIGAVEGLTETFVKTHTLSPVTREALSQAKDSSEPPVFQEKMMDRFEGSDIRNWQVGGAGTGVALTSDVVYSGNESLAVQFSTPGKGTHNISLWTRLDDIQVAGVEYHFLAATDTGAGAVYTKVRMRSKKPQKQYALKFYSELFKQKLPVYPSASLESAAWQIYDTSLPGDVSKVLPEGDVLPAPVVDRLEILIRVTTETAQTGTIYLDDLKITTP